MSALGQKQTCAVQKGMSALPPESATSASTKTPERFSVSPEGFPATYQIV